MHNQLAKFYKYSFLNNTHTAASTFAHNALTNCYTQPPFVAAAPWFVSCSDVAQSFSKSCKSQDNEGHRSPVKEKTQSCLADTYRPVGCGTTLENRNEETKRMHSHHKNLASRHLLLISSNRSCNAPYNPFICCGRLVSFYCVSGWCTKAYIVKKQVL